MKSQLKIRVLQQSQDSSNPPLSFCNSRLLKAFISFHHSPNGSSGDYSPTAFHCPLDIIIH